MQFIRLRIGVILIISNSNSNSNNNFTIKHYIKKEDGTTSDLSRTGHRLIQQSLVLLGLFHSKPLVHGSSRMFIRHILYHIMRNRYETSVLRIRLIRTRVRTCVSSDESYSFGGRSFPVRNNRTHRLNIGQCNHLQDLLRQRLRGN